MASEAVEIAVSTFFASGRSEAGDPRNRICGAVVELLAARGHEGTTVKAVCERAGVTPSRFRREFGSIEAAGLAAFDEMTAYYNPLVECAFEETQGSWQDKLRAAAYKAARCLRDNPVDWRFGVYEMMRISDLAQTRREANFEFFADMVDAGRAEAGDRGSLTRSTAESVFGSVLGAVLEHMRSGGPADPSDYVPQLMYVAVRPYLGHEAALRELTIPPPPDEDLRVR